jgi:hypothetical protein
MEKLRWNWPIWLGFILSIAAFVSYFAVFARFPITRNVPWVNFLLFAASVLFLCMGLRRIFAGAPSMPRRVLGSLLALAGVAILGGFCFFVFHAGKQLPAAVGSPKIGLKAPEFSLRDTHGNLVSLATLLASPLDAAGPTSGGPQGVLLVFYRGYW